MNRCSFSKCHKEFSVKGINTHFIRAHEGRNFVKHRECCCDICGKTFTSSQALSGHTQRSHTDRHLQSALGSKGNARKRQMRDDGYVFPKYKHTEEMLTKLSILACERLAKHSKYSKNVEYQPGIILESSYEVRVAEILDDLGVEWIKVRQGYEWDDNGKKRRYIPDFYLPSHNIFLDPKNDYLIQKDKIKIDSAMSLNNIKVVVLDNSVINKEFLELLLL